MTIQATATFRNEIAVCENDTCRRMYNPTLAGCLGQCGRCATAPTKAAKPVAIAPTQAPTAPRIATEPAKANLDGYGGWAIESDGTCNRCSGTGNFKSFGPCYRCKGTGTAPGFTKAAKPVTEKPASTRAMCPMCDCIYLIGETECACPSLFEEVTLDLTDAPIVNEVAHTIRSRRLAFFLRNVAGGIGRRTGWEVSTPNFARRQDGGFDVIPF